MLTPQQLEKKVIADRAKLDQVALDYADLIAQHGDLAKKIISELVQVTSDLDDLQVIQDNIDGQDQQTAQQINGFLMLEVAHRIPTIKARIEEARALIFKKN